mgnify:CR=1 FL=1|tara:strand:- start:3768 stop:4958 length:1191 start_codon:yes stop_codon:yes gene_type:complete
MVRDLYGQVGKFKNSVLNTITNNPDISEYNKKLLVKWLHEKKSQLQSRKGIEIESEMRWSKTIAKYVCQAKNVGMWFPDKKLDKLSENDIKKFYTDFETGKIKNQRKKGFSRKSKDDYYSKIFKGSLGKFLGINQMCIDIMIREAETTPEVKFIWKEDLDTLVKSTNLLKYKVYMLLSFDLCLRVGETLQLEKRDFQLRYNENTKQNYYKVRIRKEITKSQKERRNGTLIPETTELLERYLKTLKNPTDLLFPDSYQNYRQVVYRLTEKTGVRCQPDNQLVTTHVFRKAGATHWLKRGFSIDQVKNRLGHKPSSRVIDLYVSYLGLDEDKSVEEIQTGDISEMTKKYNESQEQKIAQDERLKFLEEKLTKLEKDKELDLDKLLRVLRDQIMKEGKT